MPHGETMADLKQTRNVTVDNRTGLHLRAGLLIAKLAAEYEDADLALMKGSQRAQASRLWDIIALVARARRPIADRGFGAEGQEALEALERLFANKFDEPDEDPRAPG